MNAVEAHLIAAGGDPCAAARVSLFMRDDCPRETPSGKWMLKSFHISEEQAQQNEIAAAMRGARHGGVGTDHWVPEGDYVTLKVKRDWRQFFDKQPGEDFTEGERLQMRLMGDWEPMMSDTPNEIEDHDDVIKHARGRVLIHGLGLGCIIAALHVIPEVEHIDVVEYDPEVIKLTGRYYATLPKVSIRQGSALTYEWPKGARWDYVWHDIWARISADNLDPEDAENGITYQMLFDRFADRADRQAAWAYEKALAMSERHKVEEGEARDLIRQWHVASPRERADFLLRRKFTIPGLGEGIDPDQYREVVRVGADAADGFRHVLKQVERSAQRQSLSKMEALIILGYLSLDDL